MAITDGTANTFMVVESSNPVLWTKPEDIEYDPATPRSSLGWSMPDRFLAAFVGGGVRSISKNIPDETLRRLIDPADGQVIDFDELER